MNKKAVFNILCFLVVFLGLSMLISAAWALKPMSRLSATPAAIAITFLSAPATWTPIGSLLQ